MWLGRVRCAVALSWLASCSFPNYDLYNPPTGSSGQSGLPPAACDDGAQNGAESDLDCGGNCKRCEVDQRCAQATDCASLVCAGSICQPSNCQDAVRNGLETGVDCGGGCPGCANGAACTQSRDCTSQHCEASVCVDAGCADGILNGQESDQDCGGPECAPCGPDKKCEESSDCASRACREPTRTCAAPTCEDDLQNQDESDVDCGGPSCAPCALSQGCFSASDCESALCRSELCVPLDPAGQPLSTASWTIRTSESSTELDPEKAIDGDLDSCWTSGAAQYAGMYVEIDLGKPQYFFRALLRVTSAPNQDDFPARIDVGLSDDGTFGEPVQSAIEGNQYTWIHFPTAQVTRYVRFTLAASKPVNWSIGDLALYN